MFLKNNFIWFVFVLMALCAIELNAQTNFVNGKVIAFNKFPLKGVNLKAKKSKNSVKTDSLGFFKISCKKKDLIRIELEGFESQYIKLKNLDSLFVNLIYSNNNNSYESVIANKSLDKSVLDYCVENLLVENNNFETMNSIFQIIQNIYPGANITSDTGSEKILLDSQGPNSAFADPYALLVVDGIIVTEISSILPLQVADVKVLIGNEAAHWGLRGANGVIEITLKKGML